MRNPGVGRIDQEGRALLSIDDAANYLGVCRRTIQRLIARGVLDTVGIARRSVRKLVTIDSLEAYRMQKGTSSIELARRVLELERKVAFLMNRAERPGTPTYDEVRSELKKRHPELYGAS